MGRGKRRHSRVSALVMLGLEPDATVDDIKHAYRELAKRFHPDLGGDHANVLRFQEIQEAYETLMSKEHDGRPTFLSPVSEGSIEPVSEIHARVVERDGKRTIEVKRPGMPRWWREAYEPTTPNAPTVDVYA